MKKSFNKLLKEFFPKIIFSLFFVYVICLGIINTSIEWNRGRIEEYLATQLDAQSVSIGNISNLLLFFISDTELKVIVNDELSLSIEGIYIYYRIFTLFTKDFAEFIKEISIDKITFSGHTVEIRNYRKQLAEKFSSTTPKTNAIDPLDIISLLNTKLNIKQISITANSLKEFWHRVVFDDIIVQIQQSTISWNAHIQNHSVWSNSVFLVSTDITFQGEFLLNKEDIIGNSQVIFNDVNFIGIPFITEKAILSFSKSNEQFSIDFEDSNTKDPIIFEQKDEKLTISLGKTVKIAYDDFEEYKLIDYVFKPGTWTFDLDLTYKDNLDLDISFKSPQHPSYGLKIDLDPTRTKNLYTVLLDLKTHYFGGIKADLFLPIRKGFYPLPGGTLVFDKTRFILNGLIFSGNAIADVVPNKNAIDVTLFDVHMNGGRIGNTSARLAFTPEILFHVTPRPLYNAALDINTRIGGGIIAVEIDLYDVDGDFVAQNIKIPLFGIKDSRYSGFLSMGKTNRKCPFTLEGTIEGFLDKEKHIDASLNIIDNYIQVEKFHVLSPDIYLSGDIYINSFTSNTVITIDADGSFRKNDIIPVDLDINVQKYKTTVSGIVDELISVETLTSGIDTTFNALFKKYPLKKLGVQGTLDANLDMIFDDTGIVRFAIQEALWTTTNRSFTLDFDSYINPISRQLYTSSFRIGMDREILDGYGYFSFLPGSFDGSFAFNNGGLFRFSIGRYIVKSQIQLKEFGIDNIFNFSFLESFNFLQSEESDTTLLTTDTSISGTWDNLSYKGSLYLENSATDDFQFSLPKFFISKNSIFITNVRLRHPKINIDTDAYFSYIDNNVQSGISGAFAFENLIKTTFEIDYDKKNQQGKISYRFPNLYILSKKPLNVAGKIYHNNQELLFLSDHARYGLVGEFTTFNGLNNWHISFLSESVIFNTMGSIDTQQNINVALNSDLLLDKMNFSGDIRKIIGNLGLSSQIRGTLSEPIVSGNIDFNNIKISLNSLRNPIELTDKQSITINNNRMIFPDIIIKAGNGGNFSLSGEFSLQGEDVGNADISFYSKHNNPNEISFLHWNLGVPFLSVQGRTHIKNIDLIGPLDNMSLTMNIQAANMSLGLQLDDTLNIGTSTEVNPLVAFLTSLNLDINVDFINRLRFTSQLFNLEFDQQTPITIQGNIGDNTAIFNGNFNVERGKLFYLNTDLKVVSGTMQFSGEDSDPLPFIAIDTENSRNSQNELIDIYVNFEGKLPNLELSSITSAPTRNRTELLNLIGFGGGANSENESRNSINSSSSSAQDLLAGSVGVAENALFTNPLTRRIQRLVPFLDTFQIKTDVLGNITRNANNRSGNLTALDILHGSELEVGRYLPGIKGLRANYNLRLESPDNSGLDVGTSLNQIHKVGVEYVRNLPYQIQLGIGANLLTEVEANNPQNTQPELLLEGSLKKRF